MTTQHDFLINDLGFNLATSKDRPYERATAQFRKEQFDSQQTVGDQSLAGWWTRGQLSFHKGNGVLYYEALEGETVLNRYDSAKGVNPFTPGQVSLAPELEELDTGTVGVEDVVKVSNLISGDRLVCRGDNGKVYQVTTGAPFASQTFTQIPTAGTGLVSYIAASRFNAFFAVGDNIETWKPGDAASTVLWTGSLPTVGGTSVGIKGIWHLKNRLWVVDGMGNWYVLGTNGGAFNAANDAKFSIKDYAFLVSNEELWGVADSPGPVYISAFNEVYSVTVEDEGGLLPTIGSPTLAVRLPEGENIACLGYTLGTLAMPTDQGVRFALQTSDGRLAYGPRLGLANYEGAQRMAAHGTRISTFGEYFEEKGLWSYDLGNLVDTLEPAYTLEVLSEGGGLDRTGAINTLQGIVGWSSSRKRLYRTNASAYAAQGSLKTGFHRFGTLDPKWFRSVLVRVGGSGGSLDVYRRDPNGSSFTETLLGTITYPETEGDLDLGPDVPTERVALKFVLNRDGSDATKAPTLLGYQLKALPLPKRQRMIRVPLMLFSDEQNRQGQAIYLDPWERLAELEALEKSNAVVTFEDRVTGESGSAYIDAVEVAFETAPSAGNDAVGGFIWLTLRLLD